MTALNAIADSLLAEYKASFFPDKGEFRRELFPKSLEFFRATKRRKIVNIFGSNRSSKSISLAYAASCWLTGDYPEWWEGRMFDKPVRMWIAGETGTLVRNNLQRYLIGAKESEGIGCFIGRDKIHSTDYQSKPDGFCSRAIIKAHGGLSVAEFKSYDQGQYRFASDTLDVVVLDEEPRPGIFTEAVTRTGTTRGIVVCGFTALKGITPLVEMLAPEFSGGEAEDPDVTGRENIIIGWEDIPESVLPNSEREILKRSYLPHEITARTQGIPSVGMGLIYPIAESEFVVPDFSPPDHWPRLFALDPGFEAPTAISWWAYDADNDAMYQYGEHYQKHQPIAVHAAAITGRGAWIPGVFDYAGGNITDGKAVGAEYRKAVPNPLSNANKSQQAGHVAVWDRLQTGRFFVFESLRNTRQEFRQYHRDERGRVANTPSHLMDTWRYAATGIQHAKQRPPGFVFNGTHMRAQVGPPVNTTLTAGLWN